MLFHRRLRGLARQVTASRTASSVTMQTRSISTGSDEIIAAASAKNDKLFRVTLNREKKLNSLSLDMIHALGRTYGSIPEGGMVWLEGAGSKAFCAGGDVANIATALDEKQGGSFEKGAKVAGDFFFAEYSLDYMISKRANSISIWDKIVMGGGVGLGFHNPVRLVTERTMFAMPETAIGLFPDVGMTAALSKLQVHPSVASPATGAAFGAFLGMTGTRLNATEALLFGVATHFVKSSELENLYSYLEANPIGEKLSRETMTAAIESSGLVTPAAKIGGMGKLELDEVGLIGGKENTTLYNKLDRGEVGTIERCFNLDTADSVDKILSDLKKDASPFAIKTLQTLQKMSPLSMKVTLEALKRHKHLPMNEVFKIEYRMALASMRAAPKGDFKEGVLALLVEKRDVNWAQKTVSEVDDKIVSSYFTEEALPAGYEELLLQ